MKKVVAILVVTLGFALNGNAQDKMMKDNVKTIALEQTAGEFTQKSVTVSEGTYIFSVSNNHVGKDVGLVLVPKGKDASKPENHIATAYVTSVVKDGEVETSKVTKLTKGEYVYFCPLNPTPQYTLTVQ
ncbi:cupredoxin domain-containing protein [Hyunsoonleella sp. SJ7]|uniref:Cupredoxin domain-containing protein n=1 Tax=Hyunsoonleella aquatilis TaxID=2762758 RepID=A0A923H8F6_9FLAO|nr:cupredoxin domain-containing protein [Hyunsoonleella aquatilis]MBC3758365.1 cupredoxin domain-containing protein [Hyunsoonleella aquatilis]